VTYTPPGWYPDPENPDGRRWWNGSEWTEYTSAAKEAPLHDPEAAMALRFTELSGTRTSGFRVPAVFGQVVQPFRSVVTRVSTGRWPTERERAAAGFGLFFGWLVRIILAIAVIVIVGIIDAITNASG
jgi:hypothetical protein